MKIGIITFHSAHNYGAMLQAYALCIYLKSEGFECEIIDYRPDFINSENKKISFINLIIRYKKNGSNWFLAFLKTTKNYIHQNYIRDEKWRRYNRFLNQLPLSKNIKESDLNKLNYDVLICGSDQIWNSHYTNGLKKVYFCDLDTSINKKISYAASSGKNRFEPFEKDEAKRLLLKLDSIMVRESGLNEYIKKEFGLNSTLVCDPVFLLNKVQWTKMINKQRKANYLLIYAFEEDSLIYEVSKNIAKELNLNIIQIAVYNTPKFDNILRLTNVGPIEFLELFANSSYVCTTSFHGTAFSLIFEKQFLCFPHKEFCERTNSILSKLGILNRNVFVNKAIREFFESEINYTKINFELNKFISDSKMLLKASLTN